MKRDLTIFLVLATATLTGCADMNAKLDCPMKPGVRCESIDQINTRINRGEIGHDDTKTINNNASYLSSIKNEQSIKSTSYKNVSNRKPLRYGETVQNIWIAPFEDTSGNYHQESNVYAIVKPGHWIGYPVKEINDDEVN